jgi:hypothetical protein
MNNRYTEQSNVTSLPRRLNKQAEMERQLSRVADALAELYDLLEQYAPVWYTREQHERAESALRLLKRS